MKHLEQGDWIKQEHSDMTYYAVIIKPLKNGGYKVIKCDNNVYHAVSCSCTHWHPAPIKINECDVPKKIIKKVAIQLARLNY